MTKALGCRPLLAIGRALAMLGEAPRHAAAGHDHVWFGEFGGREGREKSDRTRVAAGSANMPEDRSETAGWEHFPHGADIGVRGWGATCEAAFEQAALALTAVLTEPRLVATCDLVTVSCTAPDKELLLVDWLNALVYEMATRRMLFGRYVVRIQGEQLQGQAWGEPIDVPRHRPATEVKGATFTALKVARGAPDRWVAQCVVDV